MITNLSVRLSVVKNLGVGKSYMCIFDGMGVSTPTLFKGLLYIKTFDKQTFSHLTLKLPLSQNGSGILQF